MVRLGRVVALHREKATDEHFRIGLEAIESGTGRLVTNPSTDYEGEGIQFHPDDVLFGKLRPYLAKVWLADIGGATVGDVHVYRPSKRVVPDYLQYVLLGRSFLDPVAASVFGAKMPRADWDFIRNVEVYVPNLEEQRAIADYLDRETAKIDTLIEEQQRLIDLLRERRDAVIRNATGWGTYLPDHWTSQRLSWLFQSTASGTTPDAEDLFEPTHSSIPWVTTSELREQRVMTTRTAVSPAAVETYSSLRIYPVGSLLIAMYGATIGRMAILGIEATSNQACCALVGPLRAIPDFVQYSLLGGREWLLLDAAGGGQPNINQDKVRSFRIPVPPIEEQQRIVDDLDAQAGNIDALIVETERLVGLARERRSALITAAVTGEIDVRGAAA